MKEKKFIKFLLLGVFACLFSFSVTSCGDSYDDDIEALRSRDKELNELIETLKATQKNWATVPEVEAVDGKVTTVDGKVNAIKAILGNLAVAQVDSLIKNFDKWAKQVDLNALNDDHNALKAAVDTLDKKRAQLSALIGKLTTEQAAELSPYLPKFTKLANNLVNEYNAATANGTKNQEVIGADWMDMVAKYNERIANLEEMDANMKAYMAYIQKQLDINVDITGDPEETVKNLYDAIKKKITGVMDEIKDAATDAGKKYDSIQTLIDQISEAGIEDIVGKINFLVEQVQKVDEYMTATDVKLITDLLVNKYSVNSMITHIAIVKDKATDKPEFTFNTAGGTATFSGVNILNNNVQTGLSSILVRVTPANAKLDDKTIGLVNSKNGDINGFVTLKATQYAGDLTRGLESTGLYLIEFSMVPGITSPVNFVNDFTAATQLNGKQALFAIAVENEIADTSSPTRYVLTDYDITIAPKVYTSANTPIHTTAGAVGAGDVAPISFTVNGTSIDDIMNSGAGNVWDGSNYADPTKVVNGQDDRQGEDAISADPYNSAIEVKLDMPAMQNVFAYYIVLSDNQPQMTSGKTPKEELIEGINKVYSAVADPVAQVTVNDPNMDGEIVNFVLYAVNADGTLVDPDGREFSVACGEKPADGGSLTLTVNIPQYVAANGYVSTLPQSFAMPAGVNRSDVSSATITFKSPVSLTGATVSPCGANGASMPWSTATHIKLNQLIPSSLIDGNSGATLSLKGKGKTLVNYVTTVTKTLPAAVLPQAIKLAFEGISNAEVAVTYIPNVSAPEIASDYTSFPLASLLPSLDLSTSNPEKIGFKFKKNGTPTSAATVALDNSVVKVKAPSEIVGAQNIELSEITYDYGPIAYQATTGYIATVTDFTSFNGGTPKATFGKYTLKFYSSVSTTTGLPRGIFLEHFNGANVTSINVSSAGRNLVALQNVNQLLVSPNGGVTKLLALPGTMKGIYTSVDAITLSEAMVQFCDGNAQNASGIDMAITPVPYTFSVNTSSGVIDYSSATDNVAIANYTYTAGQSESDVKVMSYTILINIKDVNSTQESISDNDITMNTGAIKLPVS